jgi:hypothetical protein
MITFKDLLTKEVKLEFGNEEHINAIDAQIAAVREAEERKKAEEDEDGPQERLKYYSVTLEMSCEVTVNRIQFRC